MRRSLRNKRPVPDANADADTCVVLLPKSKKKKEQKNNENAQPKQPTLPVELIQEILSFLTPPQLLLVSSSCKFFRSLLTYKMVIHSAVLRRDKTLCDNALEDIGKRDTLCSIITPSPMRMLQLASACRCEHCFGGKTRHSYVLMGMFLCTKCSNSMTISVRSGKLQDLMESKLVSSYGYSGRVLREPYFSRDGSRHGPIICRTDMVRMVRDELTVEDYLQDSYHNDELPDPRELEMIQKLFAQAFQEKNERETTRKHNIMQQKQAKKAKFKKNVALVTEKLQGPTKAFAMNFQRTSYWETPDLILSYPAFDDMVGGVTSLTDKDFTEAEAAKYAEEIKMMYETLARERILGFGCLSPDCPFELVLLERLRARFPRDRDIFNARHLPKLFSSNFDNTLHDAKTCLLKICCPCWSNGFPTMVKDCVLQQVVTDTTPPQHHLQVLETLTQEIVTKVVFDGSTYNSAQSWPSIVRSGKASIAVAIRMYRTLCIYWQNNKTKAFLTARDYSDPDKNDEWVRTKNMAAMSILWKSYRDIFTLDGLLEGRKFSDIIVYHKEIAMSMMNE